MSVVNVTADAETFTCNVFLVEGERTALVDAGVMPGTVDVITEHVDSLDVLALTHQHSDHVGQLDAILDAFAPEFATYGEHPRRTCALEDGDTIQLGNESFEVVYTPGHAPDHVSFVSDTTLFGGDVVVHDDGAFEGGSFGRTDLPGQSRERLIESITELLDRMPDTVEHMYSGHGSEYHGDVHGIVETALERAERREPKYPEE